MRGEVLIERQIEQLLAAGITDITVVVGYKKEYFLSLIHIFGDAPHLARAANLPRRHGDDLVAVCLQRQALLGVSRQL